MSDFSDYLVELFDRFGPVELRRMFGGYGVFHQDLMIGIVQGGDTLYLKSDEITAPLFEQAGQHRFTYLRKGQPAQMPYYTAPADMLEDRHEAAKWARLAFEAALRRRSVSKEPAARKSVAKKPATKKPAARKSPLKKSAPGKAPVKKAARRKPSA